MTSLGHEAEMPPSPVIGELRREAESSGKKQWVLVKSKAHLPGGRNQTCPGSCPSDLSGHLGARGQTLASFISVLSVKNVWLQVFKGWTCPVGVGESDVNTEQKPEQRREEATKAKTFQA